MNMPKPIAERVVSASLHDQRQHVRQPIRERDDHDEAADEVERDLERRELLGRAADRLDAADDDRPREHGDDDADDPRAACRTTLLSATAIEFGCVNGVVVSAATPATSA